MPASADVVDFSDPRCANEFRKRFHEIKAVNIIAHLFAFVSEDTVGAVAHRANHEVRKKSMQFCAGVRWASQASAAKRYSGYPEITPIFLHENVGGRFRCAKKRMLCIIDAHLFGNSELVLMTGFDFPAFLQFTQWQLVRCVAVNFVCRCENKWRFG